MIHTAMNPRLRTLLPPLFALGLSGCGLPFFGPGVVVTPDQAKSAMGTTLDSIVDTGATLDIVAQDRWEAGPLRRLDDATLSGLHAIGKNSSSANPPRSTYVVFVPRQTGYPAYFAAFQKYRTSDYRERLHLFERVSAQANWNDIAIADFFEKTPEPQVQLDSDGYATAVDLISGTDLVSSPSDQPGILAKALYNLSRGDSDFTLDDATRNILAPGFANTRQNLLKSGIQFNVGYQPGPALFALRLKDGGALVFYSVDATQVYRPAPGFTTLVQKDDRTQWGNLLQPGSYSAVAEVSVVMVAGIDPKKSIGARTKLVGTHEGVVSAAAD